jgi:hypothetical protein
MTLDEIKKDFSTWKLTRRGLVDLSIGLATLLLHEFVAKPYYRKYIYSHAINDFHIADTLGNTLGTIAAIFIIVGLIGSDNNRNRSLIKIITIAGVVYELAQPLLGRPIDPWDIIATILTGILCVALYGGIQASTQQTKNKASQDRIE